MIELCYQYGISNHYLYNSSKCSVIVTNESAYSYKSRNRSWFLGCDIIEEEVQYKHLGVLFDKFNNLSNTIGEACSKLRCTFLSIINCGIYSGGIHPASSKTLYKTVVLPKALYGCELWGPINKSNMLKLERAHRFCIKFMQYISKYTRTDVALSLLGCLTLEAEIDKRKLTFLGQLCRLHPKFHAKQMFTYRLFDFQNNPLKVKGFIHDIYSVCTKYELLFYLEQYIKSGQFPSKLMWKKIINKSIIGFENKRISTNCENDENLHGFNILHNNLNLCDIWKLSQEERKFSSKCTIAIKLICKIFSKPYEQTCSNCNSVNVNNVEHVLLYCIKSNSERYMLYCKLFEKFGIVLYRCLMCMPPRQQLINMFSGMSRYLNKEDSFNYLKICVDTFCNIWSKCNT